MYNYISDKMNERIQNYKTNLKRGKVFETLSMVLVIVLSLKLLDGEIDRFLIAELLFIIVFLSLLVRVFIKDLVQLRRLNTDIDNKRIKNIESSKPIDIKYKIYKGRRSSRRYLKYIKIKFSNVTLILPFRKTIYLGYFGNYRSELDICKEKLLKVNANLKYFEKSKVILSGASEYYEIIKNYIVSIFD